MSIDSAVLHINPFELRVLNTPQISVRFERLLAVLDYFCLQFSSICLGLLTFCLIFFALLLFWWYLYAVNVHFVTFNLEASCCGEFALCCNCWVGFNTGVAVSARFDCWLMLWSFVFCSLPQLLGWLTVLL